MPLKNIHSSKEFKKIHENSMRSYEDLYHEEKLFEDMMDFSNKTGFSESLVGRAINSIFSFMKKSRNNAILIKYSRQLENEYLASIFRTFIKAGITSKEQFENDYDETMKNGKRMFKEAESDLIDLVNKSASIDIEIIKNEYESALRQFIIAGCNVDSPEYNKDINVPNEYELYDLSDYDGEEDLKDTITNDVNFSEDGWYVDFIKNFNDLVETFNIQRPNDRDAIQWMNICYNRIQVCEDYSEYLFEEDDEDDDEEQVKSYEFMSMITDIKIEDIKNIDVKLESNFNNLYLTKRIIYLINKKVYEISQETDYFGFPIGKNWLVNDFNNFINTSHNKILDFQNYIKDNNINHINDTDSYIIDMIGDISENYTPELYTDYYDKIMSLINKKSTVSESLITEDVKIKGAKKLNKITKSVVWNSNSLGEILGDSLPKSEFRDLDPSILNDKKVLSLFNSLGPKLKNQDPKMFASNEVNKIRVAEIQEAALLLYDNKSDFVNKRREGYEPNVRQNFTVKPRDRQKLEKNWNKYVRGVGQLFSNFLSWKDINPFAIYNLEKHMFKNEEGKTNQNPYVSNANAEINNRISDKNKDIIKEVWGVKRNNSTSSTGTYIIQLDNGYGVVASRLSPESSSDSIFNKENSIVFLIRGFINYNKFIRVESNVNVKDFLNKYYYSTNTKFSATEDPSLKNFANKYFSKGSENFTDFNYIIYLSSKSLMPSDDLKGKSTILMKTKKSVQYKGKLFDNNELLVSNNGKWDTFEIFKSNLNIRTNQNKNKNIGFYFNSSVDFISKNRGEDTFNFSDSLTLNSAIIKTPSELKISDLSNKDCWNYKK